MKIIYNNKIIDYDFIKEEDTLSTRLAEELYNMKKQNAIIWQISKVLYDYILELGDLTGLENYITNTYEENKGYFIHKKNKEEVKNEINKQ